MINKLSLKTVFSMLFMLLVSTSLFARADSYSISSPDKQKVLEVASVDGQWKYKLSINHETILNWSALGFRDGEHRLVPSGEWPCVIEEKNRIHDVWKPVWGKRAMVPIEYNEIILIFPNPGKDECKISLQVRAYNDGVAFRYLLGNANAQLEEVTDFCFVQDAEAWFFNGERHNIGPERLSQCDGERLPVMTVQLRKGFLALHEAYLKEGNPLKLSSQKGSTRFQVAGNTVTDGRNYTSAWRVVMCGDKIGELVDSHLLELLNPAPQDDFSWVKPGVATWDWRIDGALWNGYKYGMNYESWKRMIDFSARQGFQYLVLDANWYGPEFAKDSDPLKGGKVLDVKRIIQYGKEKNVGVWLYLNDVGGKNYPIEQTLKQYSEWGAAGVKYGFMTGTPQEKNVKTQHITSLCAQYHLLVDFHDYPVHPYGQMRTFPNAVTREYCKAQLDGHEVMQPKTFVTSVFVNMIAGPLDMNNGMFDLRQGRTTRVDNNQEVPSTLVSEAARTQIVFSGVTIIPDIPEYYEKYPSLLRFLSAQKMPWRESKTLQGNIGEYIVMMRQAADGNYLIGAASNEEGRSIDVALDFLPKGHYKAEITQDGAHAHYLTNRESLQVNEQEVKCGDKIKLVLAPGGGATVLIKRI